MAIWKSSEVKYMTLEVFPLFNTHCLEKLPASSPLIPCFDYKLTLLSSSCPGLLPSLYWVPVGVLLFSFDLKVTFSLEIDL